MNDSLPEERSGIDIVIPWVDPTDSTWLRSYHEHHRKEFSEEAAGSTRYRDMGLLHYTFRSFEKFTPWVRKIHLVTCGHTPGWLNLEHPQLNLVSHSDIFEAEKLPIFSSPPIEMGLNRIEGLSDRFIYFNDDMFVLREAPQSRFFVGDLPRDFLQVGVLFHDGIFSHAIHESMSLINQHVSKKDFFRAPLFSKTFHPSYGLMRNARTLLTLLVSQSPSRFIEYHQPQAHLKKNFDEVCAAFPAQVENTINSRFRSTTSLMQYTFRYWGLIKGRFSPYQPDDAVYRTISSREDVDAALLTISREARFLCLNDSPGLSDDDFSYLRDSIEEILQERLPEKSSFER